MTPQEHKTKTSQQIQEQLEALMKRYHEDDKISAGDLLKTIGLIAVWIKENELGLHDL